MSIMSTVLEISYLQLQTRRRGSEAITAEVSQAHIAKESMNEWIFYWLIWGTDLSLRTKQQELNWSLVSFNECQVNTAYSGTKRTKDISVMLHDG